VPRRSLYNSATWARVRPAVLERDGYRCRVRARGCTGAATQVDHVVSVVEGGSWFDPDNLRASCSHCNQSRGGHGGWEKAPTRITLVVGPPGADLIGYVRGHATPGDLIVDHGTLAAEMGSSAAATTVRDGMVNQLRAGKVRVPRAWLTSHSQTAPSTLPHHYLATVAV
jgi:hypothetical protein